MDILVFGDSHTAALRRGQQAIEADRRWPDGIRLTVRPLGVGHLATEPFFVDRGDHAEVTLPEYRRHFERLPRAEDPPGTVYGVSALLHPVRVWRHAAWQVFAPAKLALPGAVPLSSGMIRRLVLDDQRAMLDLAGLLRRLGRRVFAVEPPRPFRHHPALVKTPASVVMHVDGLYRATMHAELGRLGISVIGVPARCLDADGFMLPEFGQPSDPHHGNEAYGVIMMGEILAHVGSARPAPASSPVQGSVPS